MEKSDAYIQRFDGSEKIHESLRISVFTSFSCMTISPSFKLDESLTDSDPSLDGSGEEYERGNGVSRTQRGRSADETLICVLGLITLRSLLGGVSQNA